MPQTEAESQNLQLIHSTVETLAQLENQDSDLIVQMSLEMLADYISDGQVKPIDGYIRHYCDVIDRPEEADEIANQILGSF